MSRLAVIEKCTSEARNLIEVAITLMSDAGENELEDIAVAMIDRSF